MCHDGAKTAAAVQSLLAAIPLELEEIFDVYSHTSLSSINLDHRRLGQ